MKTVLSVLSAVASALLSVAQFPVSKIYGVNLGSWFVIEPYMLADSQWAAMGGSASCYCGNCIGSEWDLVNSIGQSRADSVFADHWNTWITQDDVSAIHVAGLNVVRIPIGSWIVESTKLGTDKFANGGMSYLTRGLGWLADAGIHVMLDLHGVPDQQVANNADTGRCNPSPSFFQDTNRNFERVAAALTNLTTMAHTVNEWRTVFAIELLNEPPQNVGSDPTPNYAQYLDIATAAIRNAESPAGASSPLTVVYMDYNWQYGGVHVNPADSASGVSAYDNHLYLSFGGVADANKDAYLDAACNQGPNRVSQDASDRNTPLVFGEWWLAAQSGVNPDDQFYKDFSDAQRLSYGSGAGWIFWSWKFGFTDATRAYRDAVMAGYMPATDPGSYFNANICSGR